MANVVFKDGVILTAAQLNAAMDQKADVVNPTFTGTMALPSGPVSQRPVAPAQFAFRGNSDSEVPEVYIGNAWVALNLSSQGNAPTPPSPLVVGTVTSSAIPVTWGASTGSGTITYQVQYQIAGATAWTNWGGPTNALSATITALQANTKYNVQVIASNAFGSRFSATVSATTSGIAPNAPTGLALASITSQSVEVEWNSSTVGSQPISYQVAFRKNSDSGFTTFGNPISGTSEVVTGLDPATAYFFQVTAQNSGGSAVSTDVSGTTLAAAGVAPNAPTNLAVSGVTQNDLTLTWTASSTGTTPINYTPFAQTDGGAFVQLGTPVTGTSKAITGLNPGTTYNFIVKASNSAGTAQSNQVSATTSVTTPGTTGQVWGTQYSSLAVPIMQGPVAGQVATSKSLAIKGISVNDPPAANTAGNCSLTASCSKNGGTLSSTDASGNPVAGSGTSSIGAYLGSLSSIATVLNNLVYTAPVATQSDVINLQFTDQANNTAQINISINVVQGAAPSMPWGKSSLPGPGNIATDGSGTTAIRVQDILGNVGVYAGIDKYPSPYYGNITQIENAINYTGISLIRSSPDPNQASSNTTWLPQIKNNVQVVGGLSYWLQILNQAQSGFQPELDLFVQMAASGYVAVFEGEGAADDAPDGVAAAEAFQPTIFNAAQTANVKTGTFDVTPSTSPSTIPSQAAVSDYGTVGFTPVDAPFDSGFTAYLQAANTITPGKPAALVAFGWQSFPEGGSAQGQQGFASENACAAYMLDCIFDAQILGFFTYFWEALADDPQDYTGPTTYGLFDSSWNPKPAGTAMRNMNLLLMDQATNAHTFTPGKLEYGLSVAQAGPDQLGLHSTVLQRADGAFFLVVWNEQILQDLSNYPNQTNAEITVAPISVTLTLTTSATSIAVYDPMVGTAAVQTGSGKTITLSVPAHPIFVEIVRP